MSSEQLYREATDRERKDHPDVEMLAVMPVENVDLPFDSDGKRITWTDLAKRFDELLKKADNE